MTNNSMWEPCRIDEIDLWHENHSPAKLRDEQKLDFTAYKLGFEMKEEVDDPENKAYKFFSDDYYPDGNVVRDMDYDPSLPVALCMDFNRRPQTAALAQKLEGKEDDKYLVFEQIWLDEGLTQEQGDNAVSTLRDWNIEKVILYGDNTSNQRAGKYGRTGKNDWQVIKAKLEEAGIKYDTTKLKKSNPKRKVRVDKVNSIIYAGKDSEDQDIRRLLVHKRCDKVIRDYQYSIIADSGKDEGLKIDDGDKGHISDACDYFIWAEERGATGLTYVL